MARIKFHTLAALIVLVVAALWVGTGRFSSVGSALEEAPSAAPKASAKAEAKPTAPALRTVAFVKPVFIDQNRTIRISGVTEADKRATLAARAAGIVGELKVRKGDHVEKDDVVLRLDAEDKAAMVKTAKSVLEQRQVEYDSTAQLVERGSSPKRQSDNARSQLMAAKSQLEQAEAEIARLEVKSPFAGLIDKVEVEQGVYVQAGDKVATLLKLDPIIAKGEVGERDLAQVTLGAQADVRLITGEVARGTVRAISRDASAQTRTFPVEVAIANPSLAIPAGMTAEITLRAAATKAVMLPRSVVTLSAEGELGIRVLLPDDSVGFVPIDVIEDTPKALVLGGVPAEARIIVAGQDLVANGDKVLAVEADAAMIGRLAKAAGATP